MTGKDIGSPWSGGIIGRGRAASLAAAGAVVLTLVGGPVPPAGASIDVFLSSGGVSIPTDGAGSPYPSSITLSRACGVTSDVDVLLQDVSHSFPDDIDILLVGPGGQNAVIMSDAGGTNDFIDADITLDDQAAAPLSDEGANLPGSYQPANYGTGDLFSAPAPGTSGSSAHSVFNGTNPNGTWNLFVMDDLVGLSGTIDRWGLRITSTPSSEICIPGGATSVGPAAPYPDTTTVSGMSGTVTDVNLMITGFSHGSPYDADLLLVGPGGQNTIVMSDAGSDFSVSGVSFTLDDEATGPLPNLSALVDGSVYKPANHPGNPDSWGPTAPVPSGGSILSVFDGTNPNGTWSLFVTDDEDGAVGRINDWSLQITTPAAPGINPAKAKAKEGKPVTFQVGLSAAPTLPYTVPFTTVAGSAKQGKDFKSRSGSLTFNPGETSGRVKVKTKDDAKDEKKRETFSLQLTTPTGNVLLPARIKDNDK